VRGAQIQRGAGRACLPPKGVRLLATDWPGIGYDLSLTLHLRGMAGVGAAPLAVTGTAPGRIEQGDQLVVHVTAPARFGIALLFATGSDAHLKAVRALARRKGLSLDAEGPSRKGRIVAQRTEEEIYAALGLPSTAAVTLAAKAAGQKQPASATQQGYDIAGELLSYHRHFLKDIAKQAG